MIAGDSFSLKTRRVRPCMGCRRQRSTRRVPYRSGLKKSVRGQHLLCAPSAAWLISVGNIGCVQGYIDKILGPDITLETVEGNQNELQRFAGLGMCLEDIELALQRFGIGFSIENASALNLISHSEIVSSARSKRRSI